MNRCYSLAALAAAVFCCTACAEGDDVALQAGGMISIGRHLRLSPMIMGNNWNLSGLPYSNKPPSPKTGEAKFALLRSKTALAQGVVKALPAGNAVHVTVDLVPNVAFKGNEMGLSAFLDERAWGGQAWRVGDADGRLPPAGESFKGIRRTSTNMTLNVPGMPCPIKFAFDDPSLQMLQSFKGGTALRMGRSGGSRVPGEHIAFAFTISRADGRPLALRYAPLYTITTNADWRPFNYRKDIVAGSALDFSLLGLQDAPAGKHGWLKGCGVNFAFEDAPSRPVRFYGANLCFSANYPDAEMAERLTTRLARLGYNSIRVHHYDGACSTNVNGEVRLVPEQIDRLDRLLAAAIRKGLYITTDLYVSRRVAWRDIGFDRPGKADCVKTLFQAWEPAYSNWCQFARAFLTHRNPYTGRTYAEEPAMPFIVLINEAAFHGKWNETMALEPMRKVWRDWLVAQRAADPGCYPGYDPETPPAGGGWWNASAKDANVKAAFSSAVEAAFVRRAKRFLREELGVKALITGQNFGPSLAPIQAMRDSEYDYVDLHFYVDHPQFLKTNWSMPASLGNANPALSERTMPESMAYHRLWSRPYTISEYNFAGPGQFRAAGGALTGALAAIQGWGALWRFAYSHGAGNLGDAAQSPGTFDAAVDALGQASDRVAMLLYLRGDMPPAQRAVSCDYGAAELDVHQARSWGAPPWTGDVPWRMRVGSSVNGRHPGDVAGYPGRTLTNSVPPFAAADVAPSVEFDHVRGSFTFATPRCAGGFAEEGRISAGPLEADVADAPALVCAAALDGRPVASSRRILVMHLTDVQAAGVTYMNEAKRVLLHGGRGGSLARRGTAAVMLRLEGRETCTVYALDTSGARTGAVSSRRDGDLLSFTCSTAGDGVHFHYEIVR